MKRASVMFLFAAALMLMGCSSRAFGNLTLQVEPIDQQTITRTMQYAESSQVGPTYEVAFTVPAAWVGSFQTRNRGNSLAFEFVNERGRGFPIFTVDVLSNAQYWEQVGSFPGDYNSLLNTADTYFVYNLPIDAFYSGLPGDDYAEYAEAVPAIVASFTAQRIDE